MLLNLCLFTLSAAILLGGGTRAGFSSDVVLQLASLPLFLAAITSHLQLPSGRRRLGVLAAAAVVLLVPTLQLLPLPTTVWSTLPHRAALAQAFQGGEAATVANPMTLAPRETWIALASLVTPVGIFLGVVLLSRGQRRAVSIVLIAGGLVSGVLGMLQVAQGPASPLRFYAFTNPTEAVGFFANRNHLAALIYCTLLFVSAWVIALMRAPKPAGRAKSKRADKTSDSLTILYVMGSLTVFVMLLAAQAMTRSRAGMGLTIVALGAVLALAYLARASASHDGAPRSLGATRALIGGAIIAGFAVLPLALGRVTESITRDPLDATRLIFARNTLEAALSYMPWGAGIGSFVYAYPMFEKPADMMADVFANRAHNDVLEFWLEAGVLGPLLMAAFGLWLIFGMVRSWRAGHQDIELVDRLLSRAAAFAAVLIAVHSAFDYPLRTGAMMAVMAVCCALLVPPILARDDVPAAPIKQRAQKSSSSHPLSPVKIAEAVLPSGASGAATSHRSRQDEAPIAPDVWSAPSSGGLQPSRPPVWPGPSGAATPSQPGTTGRPDAEATWPEAWSADRGPPDHQRSPGHRGARRTTENGDT